MSREFLPPTGSAGIVCEPTARPHSIDADAVVVFLPEGGINTGVAAELDIATGGMLTRLSAAGELSGRRYECVPLLAAPGLRAGQLLVVGLGKREDLTAGVVILREAEPQQALPNEVHRRPPVRGDLRRRAAGHVGHDAPWAAAGRLRRP